MKISILTLFPAMFTGPFTESIIKRAQERGIVEIELINIRDFGLGDHQMVDDTPYGGGIGMVLKVDVLHKAINHARRHSGKPKAHPESLQDKQDDVSDSGQARMTNKKHLVILTSAGGKTYDQQTAKKYSKIDHLIIVCGHYEGVDERVMQYIDEEVSIGDFVLTGGEIPAMLITDSVTRLIQGVITKGATEDESFTKPLLEYPHYTKPRSYDGQEVPEVLVNGDHGKIKAWREEKAREKTNKVRPDLLKD